MPSTRLTTDFQDTGQPVKCQLVVVEGPDMGRAVTVTQTRSVGSDASCDLPLRDDTVSAKHLEVQPDGANFLVRDLGSSNGTWYQGSRLTEASVPAGATLKVGRSFLRLQPQPRPLEVQPSQSRRFGELVAESLAMREVFAVLELAAKSDVTVLVQGETGTGKELVARALHDASARRSGPFVAVDCGALPESLLESELFGHVKGAFTGANTQRAGAFLRAHGGTLFLDELGAISPAVQSRLLRAIEERKVKPVGADDEKPLDVRVVAASRHDLSTQVAEGSFRPDLYYRLSVLAVELPPLRQRREDLAPIVAELLKRRGFGDVEVKGPGFDRLRAHGWPGNVRELRNVIDRAVALSPGARDFASLKVSVASDDAAEAGVPVRTDLPFKEAKDAVVDVFERQYLRDVAARFEGNLSAAARFAEVDRKHWRALLKKHGLASAEADEDPPRSS